jgi:hypothetical protein
MVVFVSVESAAVSEVELEELQLKKSIDSKVRAVVSLFVILIF